MIKVLVQKTAPFRLLSRQKIIRAAQAAYRCGKKIRGTVEINLVGEQTIKNLNCRFRGINKSTDVLSFAWREERKLPSALLGQLYLCYPYIVRQAKRFKVPVKEEFIRSLMHGLLHIVGYDHAAAKEAARMFRWQEKLVEQVKKKRL